MRTAGVGVFPQVGGVMDMNKAGPSFFHGQGPSRVEDCTISGE